MTLGEKIQKLRKQRGLSQEALAEKVTVTRQTISKWELGQSTPDLDFIAQLSDIFNVSSDYLIKDEMIEPDELLYKKRSYHLSERGKRIILVVVSAAALIAGCVCLICDYFTSDRLSWSLIAVASIIAAWLMLLPSLISRTRIVLKTLVAVSVIPFPLLAILSLLLKRSVIFTLGVCITLIVIAAIWTMYIIFRKCRKNLWRAFGFALLVLIPVPIAITHITACFLPQVQFDFTSDIFNSGITLALSLVCFGVDANLERQYSDATEPLYICGLSLGALLALDFTIRHGDKVASLVLIGAQYKVPTLLIDFQNLLFRCMPAKSFYNMGLSKSDTIKLSHSMRSLDFTSQLSKITCPVTVLCGEKDRANLKASKKLNELLSQATLQIVSGAGHEINKDAPEVIAAILNM